MYECGMEPQISVNQNYCISEKYDWLYREGLQTAELDGTPSRHYSMYAYMDTYRYMNILKRFSVDIIEAEERYK